MIIAVQITQTVLHIQHVMEIAVDVANVTVAPTIAFEGRNQLTMDAVSQPPSVSQAVIAVIVIETVMKTI